MYFFVFLSFIILWRTFSFSRVRKKCDKRKHASIQNIANQIPDDFIYNLIKCCTWNEQLLYSNVIQPPCAPTLSPRPHILRAIMTIQCRSSSSFLFSNLLFFHEIIKMCLRSVELFYITHKEQRNSAVAGFVFLSFSFCCCCWKKCSL